MPDFKLYRKKQLQEMRPVTEADIAALKEAARVGAAWPFTVTESDLAAGSPKPGDMIARNPADHSDQWLVSEKFFQDNYEEVERVNLKELVK